MTWCVGWAERKPGGGLGPLMWCATKNGRRPKADAANVRTRCDHVVIFPAGIESGMQPTCPECLAVEGKR
jgi:hypothetical protein